MIDLESTGLRSEALKFVYQGNNFHTIQIGEKTYGVFGTGINEEPGQGVHLEVMKFLDSNHAEQMDGAHIKIEPGHSTPIEYFAGPRVFMDAPIAGNGIYLSIDPENKVFSCYFDADNGLNQGLVVYGQGWVNTWIAGDKGLEILEVCVPPFIDDGRIIKGEFKDDKIGERVIPASFKIAYKTETSQAK